MYVEIVGESVGRHKMGKFAAIAWRIERELVGCGLYGESHGN